MIKHKMQTVKVEYFQSEQTIKTVEAEMWGIQNT